MKRSGLEPAKRAPLRQGSSGSALRADNRAGGAASSPVHDPEREPQTEPQNSPPSESVSAHTSPSRSGLTQAGALTAEAMKAAERDWADRQITTSSCMFCDWGHEGTASECRDAALAHRQVEHPEACIRRARPRGSRITKKKLRSAGEEEQIKVDAAEANRLRSEREQGEMLAKIERGRERDRAAALALDGAV